MFEGTINGFRFKLRSNQDGKGSHGSDLPNHARSRWSKGRRHCNAGDRAGSSWPEPKVPADLKSAFTADQQAHHPWDGYHAMARWDWIPMDRLNQTTRNRVDGGSRWHALSSRPGSEDRVVLPFPMYRSLCMQNGVLLEPSLNYSTNNMRPGQCGGPGVRGGAIWWRGISLATA